MCVYLKKRIDDRMDIKMFMKFRKIMKSFMTEMKDRNISAHAACTAFFFFLSIVPMLMLICTILPYTPITEANLVNVVTDVTPDTMDALATGVIDEVYRQSTGILPIAVIAMIWSAGQGVLALIHGLNAINKVDDKRNIFFIRVVAMFYTLIMLTVIVLFLFVMVFGNQLAHLLLHRVPQLQMVASFYMEFRFLVVWAVLTLLFSIVYARVSGKRMRVKEQIPGASFTAVVWSVFSWGFSLYVSRSGAYSIYGSLSIIIIVMIWMYLGMYIVLIGAYLNHFFHPVNQVIMGTKKDRTGNRTGNRGI